MDFWFEFFDIHMNEKSTICHDCHGFKWQNINVYLILTIFWWSSTLFGLLDYDCTPLRLGTSISNLASNFALGVGSSDLGLYTSSRGYCCLGTIKVIVISKVWCRAPLIYYLLLKAKGDSLSSFFIKLQYRLLPHFLSTLL
jgi:hypothetical protein